MQDLSKNDVTEIKVESMANFCKRKGMLVVTFANPLLKKFLTHC
jgi:hypothetical protein